MYLRRQVIWHLLVNFDKFKEDIMEDIRMEYGRIDSEDGPFSVKQWCQYILTDKKYCDSIFVKLLSSMWGIRISLIRSDNCQELKFRHNFSLEDADLVLLFNSSPVNGHYSAVIKVGKDLCEYKLNCKHVKKSTNYDETVDVLERLERKDVVGGSLAKNIIPDPPAQPADGNTISISREEYERLKECEKQLETIKTVLGGGSLRHGKRNIDEGQGRQKGQKKRRVEMPFEGAEQVKDIQMGDLYCQLCNMNFTTTKSLHSHVAKCHLGDVLYKCDICGKGFMSKVGIEGHKVQHLPASEKLACSHSNCNVTFARAQSLKKHLKNVHGKQKAVYCNFCKKSFKTKDNKVAHEMGCKENTQRKELFCGKCGKGGFYLPKRVMEHKRDVHGFV